MSNHSTQETAAYVAASLALAVVDKDKGVGAVVEVWTTAYNAVLDTIVEKDYPKDLSEISFVKDKLGPRKIPVVSQESIQAKLVAIKADEVHAGSAVSSSSLSYGGQKPVGEEVDVNVAATHHNIIVHKASSQTIPAALIKWCDKNDVSHVYDNRPSHAEKSTRPLFKACDEKGHDIKDRNGKTLSFWASDLKEKDKR